MKKEKNSTGKTKKRTKLKKVIPNLVKVLATSKILLRDMKVARQGETIEVSKDYADILVRELGFKIIK